jgi:hypothetical protein
MALTGAAALAATNAAGVVAPGQVDQAAIELWTPKYYIAKAADAAGTGNGGNALFRFFFDTTAGLTNITNPGKLTNVGIYAVHGIGFTVDIDSGTAMGGVYGESTVFTANAVLGLQMAETLRKYLKQGALQIKRNTRVILDDYGLEKYPGGGGPSIHSSIASGITTATGYALPVNNGEATVDNRFWFPRPIPFGPGDTIAMQVDFGTKIAAPATGIVRIIAHLWGIDRSNPQD